MKKGVFSANIRQRRDEVLGCIQSALVMGYFFSSLLILGLREANGMNIGQETAIVYASYLVIMLLVIFTVEPQGLGHTVLLSSRSIIALAIVLILAFPVRLFLHGIAGYKKYALHEIKRITKMEMSRWKERLQ